MPADRVCGSRHYSGNEVDGLYDRQYMEIKNLCRQIEILAWCLDPSQPWDQLFHESAYECDDDLSVHSDRQDAGSAFEGQIYIAASDGDSNNEVIVLSIDDHGCDHILDFSNDVD